MTGDAKPPSETAGTGKNDAALTNIFGLVILARANQMVTGAVSKQGHRRIIKEYGNFAFVNRGKSYYASQTYIVDAAAYVTFQATNSNIT